MDLLPGAFFDIRLEVHAPVNGSEASPAIAGVPDQNFTFTVGRKGARAQSASAFFSQSEPRIERWNFTWFEDLFAREARRPSLVQVAAKAFRKVTLTEPGEYVATLTYYNGTKTEATWTVRNIAGQRRAKNVILFIGDGMTTAMITAARLIAHRTVNGKYQSRLQMDKFPVLGHQVSEISKVMKSISADIFVIDDPLSGLLHHGLSQLGHFALQRSQDDGECAQCLCGLVAVAGRRSQV